MNGLTRNWFGKQEERYREDTYIVSVIRVRYCWARVCRTFL